MVDRNHGIKAEFSAILDMFFKIYDTQLAVIIIFTVIQSAFGTYLLSSVFATFPREMVEAATVDGCNKVQLLFRVVAPISLPSP